MSLEIIGAIFVLILLFSFSLVLLVSFMKRGGFFRLIFGIILLYFSILLLIPAVFIIVFSLSTH